jgi:hypothetical protein
VESAPPCGTGRRNGLKVDSDLRDAGELVSSVKLTDPSQATTVRFTDGAPVPTDGPFAEVKESLAGYWIVDVDETRHRRSWRSPSARWAA